MTNIFISYRRDDARDAAGRIFDRLKAHFGNEAVFMDVDAIPLGIDFRVHISSHLDVCTVVLAIIGDRWMVDEQGPSTNTRIEIAAALKRKSIPVIPVLVSASAMPAPEKLPEDVRELAYRNGIEIRSDRSFEGQMQGLIREIESLSARAPAPAGQAPLPAPVRAQQRRAIWVLGGVVLAVLAAGGFWLGGIGPTRPAPPVAVSTRPAPPAGPASSMVAEDAAKAQAKRDAESQAQQLAKSEEAARNDAAQKTLAEEARIRQKAIDDARTTELKAKRAAELEAKRRAEVEAKRTAELEAKRRAEVKAKRTAELEAKRRAEVEAMRKADPIAALAASHGYVHLSTLFFQVANFCLESNSPAGRNDISGGAFMTPCENVTGQLWRLEALNNGYYHLRSQLTENAGLCLEANRPVAGAAMGGAAFMAPCGNFSGQSWRFLKLQEGLYHLQPNSAEQNNKCLDSSYPGGFLDGRSHMRQCSSNENRQRWILKSP